MSSDTLVATPDEQPKKSSPSADECFEHSKRCLMMAELGIPGNPTLVQQYSDLAAGWSSLGAEISAFLMNDD